VIRAPWNSSLIRRSKATRSGSLFSPVASAIPYPPGRCYVSGPYSRISARGQLQAAASGKCGMNRPPADEAGEEETERQACHELFTTRGRSRCMTVGMFAMRSRPPLPPRLSRQTLDPLRRVYRNPRNNPNDTQNRVPNTCPVRVHPCETAVTSYRRWTTLTFSAFAGISRCH
jgi:hypothetical protein